MGLHAIFSKYLSGNRILDVGFAQMPNALITDRELYGVDLQKVDKPVNYREVKTANLNKEPLPYGDAFFDTVILAETIEHVENPSHALRECNRVLRTGGRLILSTPQANYPFTFLRNFVYSCTGVCFDNDPGEHLSNWTMVDMRRLLVKNGFTVEKLRGAYVYLPYLSIPV